MDDITEALIAGEDMETGAARTLLRYAVQRQIFSPYSGEILDVRRAVLLDGTDHGGGMMIMTAAEYDIVLEKSGGHEKLEAKFGHPLIAYDGRKLFK
jgi:hypothetical protein